MIGAQPLLEHHQAEQQLVVVAPRRAMLVEQAAHGLRLQELEHQRFPVEQVAGQLAADRAVEPPVDHVDREAALLARQDLLGQEAFTDAPVQPLALPMRCD